MSFMNSLSPNFLQRLSSNAMDPAQDTDQQDIQQFFGSVPQEAFQQHTTNALSQTDPQEYSNHVTPGVGGTNPLGGLGQGLLGSVAGGLIGNMLGGQMGGGQMAQGGIGGLADMLGLSHTDPQRMNENDVAKLAQYAQQNNPQALAQTASQYQGQPDVLRSLLGNKALLMAGAGLAAGVLSGQLKPRF